MLRRTTYPVLAVLVAAGMTAVTAGTAHGSAAPTGSVTVRTVAGNKAPNGFNAGPPYEFVTELMGQFVTIPLKDQGMLTRTEHGYRFRTGQQDSHLVVTRVDRGLRFVDTGTKSFKKLSAACHRRKVSVGIAAVCRVPGSISVRRPMLVEVWPRLGNDFTDTSTLPATFAVTVLGDGGRDTARLGAGPDFFNGHSGRDHVWGGGGNDWIRSGSGNDAVKGGAGSDYIVAMEGRDTVHGGPGDDRVAGSEGDDRLWGDAGTDFLLCGIGLDIVNVDATDRVFNDCESVDLP